MPVPLEATMGLLFIAAGIASVVNAGQQARAIRKRMYEGTDGYFEEQRTLRAYPMLRDPKWIRRRGVVLIVLGIVLLALGLYDRR